MRCVGIDEKWTDQVELSYIKGGIINFESKRRR